MGVCTSFDDRQVPVNGSTIESLSSSTTLRGRYKQQINDDKEKLKRLLHTHASRLVPSRHSDTCILLLTATNANKYMLKRLVEASRDAKSAIKLEIRKAERGEITLSVRWALWATVPSYKTLLDVATNDTHNQHVSKKTPSPPRRRVEKHMDMVLGAMNNNKNKTLVMETPVPPM
jgi:hypothetical protein